MKQIILPLLLCLTLLIGCTIQQDKGDSFPMEPSYIQISAEETKTIIDEQENYIILDVRTEREFTQGHIEGAILIPDTEIISRAEAELPDKDALILIYCRSGRRSKIAAQALADKGYTNVKEFGGIIDWPYELEK